MITWVAVAYAKCSVFLLKAVLVLVAFLASPRLSAQAGHGTSEAHATPESHGSSETSSAAHAEATPAPTPAGHAEAGQAEPAHDSHAAGHGEAHAPASVWGPTMWGLPLGAWHAINFVVLFGAIFWFTRRALVASVRAKRDATAKGIEEATRLREEMKKKFEDYDARMTNIDERMASIVNEAKTESEAEMAKMVTEAGVVAQRIREDAKLIADQEIARAKRELQDEQIARAAELAEQILKASITKEDQARLADEFMSRVGQPSPKGAGGGPGAKPLETTDKEGRA